MSEFTTSGSVVIEIDQGSLREARDEVESELGSVQVDVDAVPDRRRFQDRLQRSADNANVTLEPDVDDSSIGSVPVDADMARPDGGTGTLIDDAAIVGELEEQTDLLDELVDEIDDAGGGGLGLGGGGGGGDGGGVPGSGVAAGLGIRGLLGRLGLGGAAASAGVTGGAALLGGIAIDQVGKQFGDLTSPGFANLLFGSAGGGVPPSMASTESGDGGVGFNEAVNSIVSQALGGGFDGPLATGEPINQTQPADTGPTTRTDPTYGGGYIPGAQGATPRREDVVGQGGYIPGATQGSAFASAASAGSTDKEPWVKPYMAEPTGRETIGVGGAAAGTATLGGGGGAPSPRSRDVVGDAVTGTSTLGASAAGTTATGGTETNVEAPVSVDVRAETPNTETVVSEVIRQIEPQLRQKIQRWLKQQGTTTISNEQQSRYNEGF